MQFSEEERKAKRTAQKLKWAHENPAKVVASRRKFNESHSGYNHKYSETEATKETRARWRAANREKINANQRDRAKKYPEYCRGKALDYQAKKRNQFVERVDRTVLFARDNGTCQICHEPIADGEVWWVDHIHPVSKGGEHSYANTQVSHRPCNIRKGARLAEV